MCSIQIIYHFALASAATNKNPLYLYASMNLKVQASRYRSQRKMPQSYARYQTPIQSSSPRIVIQCKSHSSMQGTGVLRMVLQGVNSPM